MARITRTSALTSLTAALAMTVSPIAATAAELPGASVSQARSSDILTPGIFEADVKAEGHRRWRGYRGYRGYRHRNRIDAGDVFAGVLILGGIAAIASAASKNKRDRDYRERDYRDRDYRDRDYRPRSSDYRSSRGDSRYNGGRGIDNAVSMCVDRIEQDVRVDTVDSVDRTGSGWRVTGALYDGERFTCRIGPDGRIDGVDYGAGRSDANFSAAFPAEGQWSDARYARAREGTDTTVPAAQTIDAGPVPAYPGGPLPGEDIEQSAQGSDDRYRTAEAPDFAG